MPKFTYKLNLDTGTVELIEVQDCTGERCKTITAPIESALGVIEDFKELPEFFVESVDEKQETET